MQHQTCGICASAPGANKPDHAQMLGKTRFLSLWPARKSSPENALSGPLGRIALRLLIGRDLSRFGPLEAPPVRLRLAAFSEPTPWPAHAHMGRDRV